MSSLNYQAFLKDLASFLRLHLHYESQPLIVHSAVWPLSIQYQLSLDTITSSILEVLQDICTKRPLLMPAFTNGYIDGLCNLDTTPSTTGALSEAYRNREGIRRTKSAFFSYCYNDISPCSGLASLAPVNAWGDQSLYHWMEQEDALFLTLGVHPTHISYLHRIEWLASAILDYRYTKSFKGTVIHENVSFELEEVLFVRRLSPAVSNDFTRVLPLLQANGLCSVLLDSFSVAAISARQIFTSVTPALIKDPNLVLR